MYQRLRLFYFKNGWDMVGEKHPAFKWPLRKNAVHLASVGNAIQKTDLTKKDVLFLDDSS